jgi:hypothetical protein
MRPITSCTVRGSYRWQRTTPSSEAIDIRNEDELFTKLPLGALALEGELQRAGRLQVRTAVSGQYVLEGSTAADVPDYGDCSGATHLLVGVSMGAFKLHSGGSLQASGGVEAGAYRAGAGTNSSETLLREAGDFESCKASTDDHPEMSCSSPIQAFLAPLPRFTKERGAGTLRVTFSAGGDAGAWELRQNQQFVCRTPCTRWVSPSDTYQLRTETGPDFQTLDVPELARFATSNQLEVRAYPRNRSRLVGGIIAAGLGGGFMFIGGMLALAGGLADRDGLLVGGSITAGVGLVALAPGVYFLATSGSKTELRQEGIPLDAQRAITPPQLGVRATF